MELEKGDKVRVISNKNGSINRVGDEGIISEVFTSETKEKISYKVFVEGTPDIINWHTVEELMKIEDQKT